MQGKPGKPIRILVADDDSLVRLALCEFLRRDGFVTYEAASGLAALEIVQKERVSFSIMDVDMPGMSGIEVLRTWHRATGAALPSIFITGDDSRARQVEALMAGAFSLLHKPVAPDVLRFTVKRLVEQYFRRAR
jgi:DNA-binding response OmpR family regulator